MTLQACKDKAQEYIRSFNRESMPNGDNAQLNQLQSLYSELRQQDQQAFKLHINTLRNRIENNIDNTPAVKTMFAHAKQGAVVGALAVPILDFIVNDVTSPARLMVAVIVGAAVGYLLPSMTIDRAAVNDRNFAIRPYSKIANNVINPVTASLYNKISEDSAHSDKVESQFRNQFRQR